MKVYAETRAFCCPRSGAPGRPSRMKAGTAPAEGEQARGEAFRWAGVVSCTAAVLASLVRVGAPESGRDGRAWCPLGLASSTGQGPDGR